MEKISLNDLSRPGPEQEAIKAAILRVVERGWFIHGPELRQFETEFAAYCGAPHAIGVANGTDAIELSLRALGVTPDNDVIVAANAGMYSATAVRSIGATLVFADVDNRHLVLNASSAQAAMTSRTRAIVVTHLYGRMADMTSLCAFAERAGIALIEDCAQAHGARQNGRAAGTWGDAGCFSFYPTKNLGAMGDAGMITCRDEGVASRLRRLRQYGWEEKYVSIEGPARNSRLDEMQAAVLRVKLPLLDERNARRRQIARRYAATPCNGLRHPDVGGDDYVAHLYVVRTHARESLRQHLAECGIATDIHYPLLDTQQPVLKNHVAENLRLPVSEASVHQIVSLPCYAELRDEEVDRVCAAIKEWTPT